MTPKKTVTLKTIWQLPDYIWQKVQPLLGKEKPAGTVGRPAISFRRVLDGILWVLRTGCQWKAVPKQLGSGSTLHRRFQQWVRVGTFRRLWNTLLKCYDEVRGIGWSWQSLDSIMTKAPLGGEGTGPNPTDRAKSGTKRHILCDRRGAPLSVWICPAHRHDVNGLVPTLDRIVVRRPHPRGSVREHLCLDKGFESSKISSAVKRRGYIPCIRSRREEVILLNAKRRHPARRWVVERDHSWFNRYRRLLIRWEKKVVNYEALVHFACAITVYRLIILG